MAENSENSMQLLFAPTGSYWVTWTKHYLLRNSSFWDIKRNTRGSWIWNKLLKLRPIAQTFLRYDIGNGLDTFFWLDNWLGQGALIQLVGEVGPSIMGISRYARVADVARAGCWSLRYHRNPLLREHVLRIRQLPAPQSDSHKDVVLWRHDSDQYQTNFSMKRTWDQLRHHGTVKNWTKLTWSTLSIPRYSFITWLAMLNRLPTGARTGLWGHTQVCVLCDGMEETRDHLFFKCSYSVQIWSQLSSKVVINAVPSDWPRLVSVLLQNSWSKEVNTLIHFLFQASIYHVWRERNGRIHGQSHTPALNISRTIAHLLTLRLQAHIPNQEALHEHNLWTTWNGLN